jgi:hypothetical protein
MLVSLDWEATCLLFMVLSDHVAGKATKETPTRAVDVQEPSDLYYFDACRVYRPAVCALVSWRLDRQQVLARLCGRSRHNQVPCSVTKLEHPKMEARYENSCCISVSWRIITVPLFRSCSRSSEIGHKFVPVLGCNVATGGVVDQLVASLECEDSP